MRIPEVGSDQRGVEFELAEKEVIAHVDPDRREHLMTHRAREASVDPDPGLIGLAAPLAGALSQRTLNLAEVSPRVSACTLRHSCWSTTLLGTH